MNILGENVNGVFFVNEFLIRVNLMKVYRDDYDIFISFGKKVVVVGGGNVVMDVVRIVLRLGLELYIVYRRSEKEFLVRVEEVYYVKEEGIIFNILINFKEILVDENGYVKGMVCIRMELGELDDFGRRRFIEIEGFEFVFDVDIVIMLFGISLNLLIFFIIKSFDINKKRCLIIDENG